MFLGKNWVSGGPEGFCFVFNNGKEFPVCTVGRAEREVSKRKISIGRKGGSLHWMTS